MADIAVSILLKNLPRLVETVYGEYKLLSGVEGKINSLCEELKFIDIFLKSSSGKRNDPFVKEVVRQIRDVAFKAQDTVEDYASKVAQYRDSNALCKLFRWPKQAFMLHGVDSEIQTIKMRIQEIYTNKEKYGITQGDFASEDVVVAPTAESLRQKRRNVEEKDIVGLMEESAQVMEKLREGDSGLKVVSIIGMGGLGKTTLSRKIYNNDHVNTEFPTRTWGYLSNDYRPTEFLLSLLKCLLPSSDYDDLFKKKEGEDEAIAASEEKLKLRLGERLKGNKYLVVLDDIWETQVWDEVKGAFPDDKNGSRILITSRSDRVALYTGTKSPYYLQKLDEEKSWQLFCNKVFGGEDCPSDLKPWGKSIIEVCDGLPLAIIVLAGLVAQMERTPRKWSQIKDVVWPMEEKERNKVTEILKLSYDYLPQRLKPCFLYFGMYPEDYEIDAKDVIQMWIAEGFIQPSEAGTQCAAEAEDIADYYLDELVSRSLVQVGKRRSDGGVKTCRIHDLVRELCIEECKRCEFMEVCTELNKLDKSSKLRRLSVNWKEESEVSRDKWKQLRPRSFFFFSESKYVLPNDVVKTFKSVRLVYFKIKGYPSEQLLSIEWKTMIHIRYLRIDVYEVEIPASVSRLWNLETLHVENAWKVSRKIWMLKRLKHLRVIRTIHLEKLLPKPDRKIKANLETLYLQSGDGWEEMMLVLKSVAFSRLRKLVWLPRGHLSYKNAKCDLEHLSNLQRLKLITSNYLSASYVVRPMQFPSNIRKITLEEINIGWGMNNLAQVLGRLTNLQILKLRSLIQGENHREFELSFGGGDFPQLQVFQMRYLRVRRWRLGNGAMPSLRHLVIDYCWYLEELPQQLWSTLRQVHVSNPSEELAQSLNTVELKNHCQLTISR